MKIVILEDFRHGRDQYTKGENRVVDDSLGAYFCLAGWAKDEDGKIETVTRDPRRVVILDVDNVAHEIKAGEANG